VTVDFTHTHIYIYGPTFGLTFLLSLRKKTDVEERKPSTREKKEKFSLKVRSKLNLSYTCLNLYIYIHTHTYNKIIWYCFSL
jgi:hypothetical protein